MLIYRSIHAEELCDGGADGPRGCPDANDVRCGKCGRVRTVEDANVPGECLDCGSRLCTIIRCRHCKLDDLDDARNYSHAGRLFERLLELEFDAHHFSIPWTEVTVEEVKGLQILKEERERYQREQMKKGPNS